MSLRIKNRLYPYPVLRSSTGDYLHSTYTCSITPEISEAECKFLFRMVCSNDQILNLIEEGKAVYAVHIECTYTYYRKLEYSSKSQFSVTLVSGLVDRTVQICPVIIATQDLIGYTNSDLDLVYADETIIIKSGNPIAIGEQASIDIIKQKDNLKKLSAPFCVLPYPEDMSGQGHASLCFTDSDQLIIYIPKYDYAIFSRVQVPKNMDTIHAAMYLPALIEALDYMKNDASDEDQEKRWYIALNAKAVDKGLGEIKGNQRSAYELAQMLFGNPLTRWLKGYTNPLGGEA